MLEGMRQASKNWFGRAIMAVLMGFIILSFAVWGIGDIFRGFGTGTVANVGSQEITSEQMRFAYQTQLQRLQQQYRRAITNDQARAMGLDRQVLGRLIAEASLDQRVKTLGLAMSNSEIAKTIQSDPNFAGITGKFDVARFNEILRDNGLNEQSFVREQRKVYLRQELSEALIGGIEAPKAYIETIHRYRNETRAIEYAVVPESAAGDIGAPTTEALQAFYDLRKSSFRADEYRKFVLLSVAPATVADPSKVSDADAKARYDRVKGEKYGTPEKRHLQQIVFPTEEEAKAASQKIKGGETFMAVAAERKLTEADVDLGTLTRGEVIDPAVAEAGFALAAGAVSEPIRGQFGFVLVRAESVTPESVKSFEEVSADLKKDIALERARNEASSLRDKVEDERTSGKSLTDAAATVGLRTTIIDGITANGIDRNGQPVASLPERDALLKAVFASDIGVDNDTISGRDGTYVWFEVTSVEPTRERTLDEVKDAVEKAWRDDELTKRLVAKGDELIEKVKGGAEFEAVMKEAGFEVLQANDVKRIGTTSVSPAVVVRAFALPVGGVGAAAGEGLSRVVFKVNDSVVPEFDADSDVMKQVGDQLRAGLAEELLSQYILKLQNDLGVKINDAAYRIAIGAADPSGLF